MAANHRTALIADLAVKGIDLADMYAGKVRVGLVAAIVEHLPPGSAVGVDMGGAAARSYEWHALRQLGLQVDGLIAGLAGKGAKRPEPWPLPEGTAARRDREAREAEKKARWRANADRRQAKRDAGELTLRDV